MVESKGLNVTYIIWLCPINSMGADPPPPLHSMVAAEGPRLVQRKGIFFPCIPFISLHNSFINGCVTPPVPDIIVGTLHTTGSQT
jgi:hypothetical protein